MTQVAIIGGGLSGLTLALYLHKSGISSAVYEARPKDFVSGGNIALSPNALRVLDHIGVYDTLRPQGFAFESVAFLNGRGGLLAKVLNGSYEEYNYPALRIRRTVLRGELIRQLELLGVPIHYEKKCAGVREETDTSATVEFEDGETVTAEFVIGADGIHSRVRSFVRPNGSRPVFQGLAGISGTFKLSDLPDVDTDMHYPCMLFGGNGSFAVMPASADGDEVSYFATFEVEERPREDWAALDADKETLAKMIKERFPIDSSWPEVVRALCHRTPTESLTLWPFYLLSAKESWSSPSRRVLLIGDATHGMPPTGGQGGATSFEDAETLAYTLAHIKAPLFNDSARPQVIQAWEDHRKDRVSKIVDFTTQNGDLRKTSTSFIHQWIKEMTIWAYIKMVGPHMGCKWMYSYHGESVRAVLGRLGIDESKAKAQ
ncbi:uncharacterized protein CCOS01_12029 [Colletotrichum costaricense]|uniref:FAD-binding domain-containing protein n=1 Tax=Colletotrichum costaricense TaxID=1209916 RepID=A0AAI9YP68_9PEZI|nr:uncharacterized protein CCOS01_12029 [Colletotrichum costaricense]KAK1517772.1 hypothetical protein CCOS01_12029 [Colletotrichum costaricense]